MSAILITGFSACNKNTNNNVVQDNSTEISKSAISLPENILSYCQDSNGYVYYITLGDNEGIHKMLPNGNKDEIIFDLEDMDINGSTSVSIEYEDNKLIVKTKQLSELDENGNPSPEAPVMTYKFDL